MDDITVATNSAEEAKEILRDLDDLLLTRGLRLNIGKTAILDTKRAAKYLRIDDNRYLDVLSRRIKRLKAVKKPLADEKKTLRHRFQKFKSKEKLGYWDKVSKRYSTILSDLEDAFLESIFGQYIVEQPNIRDAALKYYQYLGPSRKRFCQIAHFMRSEHVVDDVGVFKCACMLVAWPVRPRSKLVNEIRDLAQALSGPAFTQKSPSFFLASLWMMAKYATSAEIAEVVNKNEHLWRVSSWLSRQIAATVPRIRGTMMCANESNAYLVIMAYLTERKC